MKHGLAFTLTGLGLGLAQAHDGHGIVQAVHWHVTDVVGFVVAAVAVAVWWLGRHK